MNRQQWANVLVGFEQANTYDVKDETGQVRRVLFRFEFFFFFFFFFCVCVCVCVCMCVCVCRLAHLFVRV